MKGQTSSKYASTYQTQNSFSKLNPSTSSNQTPTNSFEIHDDTPLKDKEVEAIINNNVYYEMHHNF